MTVLKKTSLFIRRFFSVSGFALRSLFAFHKSGPTRFRLFFERSGGAFIKLGQILALRDDFLPFSYTRELLILLNSVPTLPLEQMEKVFAEDVGKPIKLIFDDFDSIPVASGSIAQVYRAKLKNSGEEVAVKIQRPGVREAFEADFILVSFLGGIIDFFGLASPSKAYEIVSEFISWTRKELDFHYESKNASIIYEHSKTHKKTVIPKQYPNLSTSCVLVQEFIAGAVPLEKIISGTVGPEKLKEMNIQREELALYLIEDEMRQYFIHGFFHADPHPANLLVLPGNKLVFLDFGIVGVASAPPKRFILLQALQGLANENVDEFCESFVAFGDLFMDEKIKNYLRADFKKRNVPESALGAVKNRIEEEAKKDIAKVVAPWLQAACDPKSPLKKRSGSRAFLKIIRLAERFNIRLPKDMVIFFRTLAILDMVALEISPAFNLPSAVRSFFKEHPLHEVKEILDKETEENPSQEGRIKGIVSMTEPDWEFFQELALLEKERALAAREIILDMIIAYADKYEDVYEALRKR